MKKISLIFLSSFLLFGCVSKEERNERVISQQEEKIYLLKSEISELESIKAILENSVIEEKERLEIAEYLITIEIKQSHFSLDIGDHLKDEMNKAEIQIPVSKEFYEEIKVGEVLNNDFRTGSLIAKGSVGRWEISVIDKIKQ